MSRVTIYPREAAALDRLLDAYIATDEGDPGREDLARLRGRVRRIRQDHTAYTRVTPSEVGHS